MYNEYEDYMRSVLGYPYNQMDYNTYNSEIYKNVNPNFSTYYSSYNYNNTYSDEYRYASLYPEIYKILKPMVKKACENTRIQNISNDDVEAMTSEIYASIESNVDVVNVNITTIPEENNVRNVDKNQALRSGNTNVQELNKKQEKDDKRCCNGNSTLRDLIKILLLNQLINNGSNKPGRPPMPPRPPRPPRPPMPPHMNPNPRPPFRNDYGYEDYFI